MEQQKLEILTTKPTVLKSPTREPLEREEGGNSCKLELATANELEVDYRFGFSRFHPDWLQVFRNAKFFTLLLCLFSLVEGAIISGKIYV